MIVDLPDFVKPYPRWLGLLVRGFNGNSVYPWVMLKPAIYDDLRSDSPRPQSVATLRHELYHYEHQKANWLRFIVRYLGSRSFRLQEEVGAYAVSARVLRGYGLELDVEARARSLSGPTYLWAASYEEAKAALEAVCGRS